MDKDAVFTNEIRLTGKVSKQGPIKYTPAGFPVKEFTLAYYQSFLEITSVGYIDVVLTGESTDIFSKSIRIGVEVVIEGKIWSRQYKNRQGVTMKELKIVAEKISISSEKHIS